MTSRNIVFGLIATFALTDVGWTAAAAGQVKSPTLLIGDHRAGEVPAERIDRDAKLRGASEVLDWNQIFIETLMDASRVL